MKESNPYKGAIGIKKKECVNHCGKRLGRRARNLPNSVLADGKKLKGRGRLTVEVIDKLQRYYMSAVRRNKNDLRNMKKDIMATFLHHSSTDDEHDHSCCPFDSWCSFNQHDRPHDYKHEHKLLPAVCMRALEPIYSALTTDSLLGACLDCLTINPNEAFNSTLWLLAPKCKFLSVIQLMLAMNLSILQYNRGSLGLIDILKFFGFKIAERSMDIFLDFEKRRVSQIEKSTKTPRKNLPGDLSNDYLSGGY